MKFEFKNSQGFTLLEVTVTILIASLLLGIAIPSFQRFIQNSRLDREAQSLYSMFNGARQEALSSGLRAFVCKSDAPDSEAALCSGTSGMDWNTGRIAYKMSPDLTISAPTTDFVNQRIQDVTLANGGAPSPDQVKQMVTRVYTFTADNVDLVSNWDDAVIVFNASGLIVNTTDASPAPSPVPFRLAICDQRGEADGKYIEINAIGRVFLRSTTPAGTDTDCTPL